MKRNSNSIVLFGLAIGFATSCFSSHGIAQEKSDFASDASFVVGTYKPEKREHSPAAIATAANSFLESLTEAQRQKCLGDLKSPKRREWTNLPARGNADGVKLGDLKPAQIKLACNLMANMLSEQGYHKMIDIMLADDQLLNGGPRNGFGTENFSLVIFGKPSETEPWCFQIDGHHVGANFSMEGENLTMSPSFIGTQPQAFIIAGTPYRPFAKETDLAHQLAMSLTDEQVKQAVLQQRRARIVTGPGNDNVVPEAKGLPCSALNQDQKKNLLLLIRQWVGDLPEAHATKRMQQIEAELDQMKFSWNGSREPKADVSYMIQSPSLIIEYACQDLGGNPLDHLHSNYRDPSNDYGGQLK